MKSIPKNSIEYLYAKSKAIHVLFHNPLNRDLVEHTRIYEDSWNMIDSQLFKNGNCYILKIGAGCWFRWIAI